jgi:WD40 repeat protein/serine/threonine protein kinase
MNDETLTSQKSAATGPEATRDQDLLAQLADEFVLRFRRGERPSVDEYAKRHPQLSGEIRDVFPAMVAMEQPSIDAGFADFPVAERVGATIGRYKLLERIGEGGFGVVFMAEQQTPVRRKVALKVVKPGMDTKQVIARFEAERQALALMDHEHIARVLDAGTTESGRPYFVMELVHGIPITEYCDKNKLAPRERLQLFLPICRAVQHAHTKGIIHRDIKPTNVLVTLHDGVPVPKVIDFGIAKAVGQQLTERTLFTNFAQMVGTPLYMSPEQSEMSGLDVDTRSDIYSLGVLLYELLTGTTPFDKDRLREAAVDEIRRIIQEEEPPNPSTRLSTLKGDKLATLSARCATEPKRLGQLVRGELDWIVMRAMEKDRTRRYETANALARDVERYLNDEAVDACPPSFAYRFKKFSRKHRAAVAATAGVLACVIVLAVSFTYAWQKSRTASRLNKEKQATTDALGKAEHFQEEARRTSAVLAMERGLNYCEQGELAHGLLWLSRSLEIAPASATDLQHAARVNIAAWRARLAYRLSHVLEHDGAVQAVAFNPEGTVALTAGNDQTARLWDVSTGLASGESLRHAGTDVHAACFSPDGKLILTAANEVATIWDASSRKPVGEPMRIKLPIFAACFSPDGNTIAAGALGGHVVLWDVKTRERKGRIDELITDYVTFRPDGKALLVGAFDRRIWDMTTLRPVAQYASGDRVTAAVYRANGRQILLGFEDGRVMEWDPFWNSFARLPLDHEGRISGIGYTPDGSALWTAGGEGKVRFWAAATRESLRPFIQHQATVYGVAVTPDGKTVLTGSADGRARLWELLPPLRPSSPARPQNVIIGLTFSPDGKMIATTSSHGAAQLWRVDSGFQVGENLRHSGTVYSADFSPDGKTLLTACSDGIARLWNVADGQLLPVVFKHNQGLLWAAFSPDGRRVLTASKDNTARVWDVATGSPVGEPMTHPAWVHCAEFSPDGSQILTGCEDGTARVWDAETHKQVGEPLTHKGPVRAVAWSPDGTSAVTGIWGDGTAWVWDIATRKPIAPPLLHRENVVAVAYHPGGKLVATASVDGTARIWDVATGKPVGPPLVIEKNLSLRALAFSPDGKSIVVGVGRGSVTAQWPVAPPATGDVKQIVTSIEVPTGVELDDGGLFRMHDAARWSELRRQLPPGDADSRQQ